MGMYLTSPSGLVVELDDQYWIERNLREGFRESTQGEIDDYRNRKLISMREQNRDDANMNDVYYQSVTPGADGYAMGRDIIKRELYSLGTKLNEEFDNQKVSLVYSHPYVMPQIRNDVRLIYTMFESDMIPEDWPDFLNLANEVIVPSKWCADVFAKRGIKTTVVPLGYNDRIFQYIDRPVPVENSEPFTFIHYNSFTIRKGFFEVLEAFKQEFDPSENVRLILKTSANRTPIPIIPSEYPNVEVITGAFSEKELSDLLGKANCMLFPSRGEGFGITPLEAMATGLPAIVPNAHGISEYFNSNYMLEVKVAQEVPAEYVKYKNQNVGNMVLCDIDDLRKQMRHAFLNQFEMKELGKAASDYVKNYTYRRTAERLLAIINKWQQTEVIHRGDSKFLQAERI